MPEALLEEVRSIGSSPFDSGEPLRIARRVLRGTQYNSIMPSPLADAFRTALELFDTGLALMRQNLRRQYPDAAESEIDRRLEEWLRDRPGAEAGDSIGRPVDLARR